MTTGCISITILYLVSGCPWYLDKHHSVTDFSTKGLSKISIEICLPYQHRYFQFSFLFIYKKTVEFIYCCHITSNHKYQSSTAVGKSGSWFVFWPSCIISVQIWQCGQTLVYQTCPVCCWKTRPDCCWKTHPYFHTRIRLTICTMVYK